ncbi:MAG: hypothetical protein M3O30_17335 [Planctomycetota bacterium]|nr:hypothetical protein [Planctomycetota bacterium]
MSDEQKYEWFAEGIAEFNRLRQKVDGLSGHLVHNSHGSITIGHTDTAPDVPPPSIQETVLVEIIGKEASGPGRYQGSIVYGNSTGNNSNTFQIDATTFQSAVDGPVPKINGGGNINNALVMNLAEMYIPDSHQLWNLESAHNAFVQGRIVGYTSENPPRACVYVDAWGTKPCLVKITKDHTNTLPEGGTGGVYQGKILAWCLDAVTYFSAVLPAVAAVPDVLPSTENCWILNHWEQTYVYPSGATAGETVLPLNSIIFGFASGNYQQSTEQPLRTVYTFTPPQMPVLSPAIAFIQTSGTAGGTYTGGEELMLNSLKTDVTNLRASLLALYTNLKNAGYSK